MIQVLLSEITKKYPLKELSFSDIPQVKAKGMTFSIKAYHAEGLGHVSVMSANGFFGLMKMDTLIINAKAKDLPLYSYDRIHAMGNDTLIIELYDTLVGDCPLDTLQSAKDEYSHLPEHSLKSNWYDNIKLPESLFKKSKKAQTPLLDALAKKHLLAYLEAVPTKDDFSPETKQQKAAYYVEGLLKYGGPCTDVFKKSLGVEKTAYVFRKLLFGTES